MYELAGQLWQYKVPLLPYGPASWLWRNCPKSSSNSEDMSYSPHIWTSISAIRGKCSSSLEKSQPVVLPLGPLRGHEVVWKNLPQP